MGSPLNELKARYRPVDVSAMEMLEGITLVFKTHYGGELAEMIGDFVKKNPGLNGTLPSSPFPLPTPNRPSVTTRVVGCAMV
jgi:hypothetical protein